MSTGSDGDEVATGPTTHADAQLLDTLRRMWERNDPMPADLADRVAVALAMEQVDTELLMLVNEIAPVGARGEDVARNVTFSSDHLTVLVTITDEQSEVRLDGWIGDGAGLVVAVRDVAGPGGEAGAVRRSTTADQDGRFCFTGLPHGLVQLVFHPTQAAGLDLPRPLSTPGVQI